MVKHLLTDWPPKHPSERRLTLKLYRFWEGVKCEDGMIDENKIDPIALQETWDSCCLLQVHDLMNKANYSYTFVGDKIIDQFSTLGIWQTERPIVSPVAKTADKLFRESYEKAVPIFDHGSFEDSYGQRVMYRQCVLPVGKAGKIEGFLAGIRLKIKGIS